MAKRASDIFSKTGPNIGEHQLILNPMYGGQFGYAPDFTNWVSKQAYIRNHIIPYTIAFPKFFDNMDSPDVWKKSFREIMERHPEVIEGLNAGLEVEVDSHPIGGAGEVYHEPVNVKRGQTDLQYSWTNTYGMGISTFLQLWIDNGLMNADTKFASVGTRPNNKAPTDMLADMYSATMLYIEPDPLHRRVVNAWLVANVWPQGTGELIGKRDLANAKEIHKLQIKFSGFAQIGVGVKIMAQKVLDSMNIANANAWTRPAFTSPDADVTKLDGNVGYKYGLDQVAKTAKGSGISV